MDKLREALQKAYALGQTYWQQADSEYQSQWKKADETRAKFNRLVEETCATYDEDLRTALAEQPAEQEWDGSCVMGHCGSPSGCEIDGYCRVDRCSAPQPRCEVELTDEEIDALPWGPSYDNPMTLTEGLREFARAVIKAYKSKQGEQI